MTFPFWGETKKMAFRMIHLKDSSMLRIPYCQGAKFGLWTPGPTFGTVDYRNLRFSPLSDTKKMLHEASWQGKGIIQQKPPMKKT